MNIQDLSRFLSHVEVDETTSCHNWTACCNDKGYGHFSIPRTAEERARCPRGGNKRVLAHKWYFEQVRGKVAPGNEVDHRCCNPRCVNLAHLQEITKAQNLALRGQVHL